MTRQMVALVGFLSVVVFSPALSAQSVDEAFEQLEKANRLASAGAISRSIPHYKKAIELAPGQIPQAYFNLAEVYRAKGSCNDAVIPYRAYAAYSETPNAKQEVEKALRACNTSSWKTLTLRLEPEGARAKIGGYLWPARDQVKLRLPQGAYKIEVQAVDHHPQNLEVELGEDDVSRAVSLEKMKFKGKIVVEAPEGAKIRIFAGPSDKTDVVVDGATPGKAVEILEGRHFVEVTQEGFDRWIRNVSVRRDDTSTVRVRLTPSKPTELR